MYDDEAEEEEVDRGEPGRFQQQGEGEHVLEVKEVECSREAPVLAGSESICLSVAFPNSKALDPFQM